MYLKSKTLHMQASLKRSKPETQCGRFRVSLALDGIAIVLFILCQKFFEFLGSVNLSLFSAV